MKMVLTDWVEKFFGSTSMTLKEGKLKLEKICAWTEYHIFKEILYGEKKPNQ